MNLVKLKKISLKHHPILNERWLQNAIQQDPSLLGIGNVVVKDVERIQNGAGRLDLLLQDENRTQRYEVEIQLGATDESHIIRTLEYWDIERRKYPQYDHVGIIIAEDITSRFLNVISLFNGFIPLMAIQVSAIETSDGIGLQFTKVLDTVKLGYLEDDEEVFEQTDRNYWETVKGTKKTVAMADQILELVKSITNDNVELNYNKHYIGFKVNESVFNFAIMRPQKNAIRLEVRLPQSEENDDLINEADFELLDYDSRWGKYRIRLNDAELSQKQTPLKIFIQKAYENK